MSEIIVKIEDIVVSIEPKRPRFQTLWTEYKIVMKFYKDAPDILINDTSRPIPSMEDIDHESVHAIYNKIGGEIKKLHNDEDRANKINADKTSAYQNSCALRLSEALNQSGFIIRGGTIDPQKDIYRRPGKIYTAPSGKKYNYRYIMQVEGFKTYLWKRWGKPDLIYTPEPCITELECFKLHSKNFLGKKGIIAFDVKDWRDATGHITVWDGSKCGDGSCFNGNHSYFSFEKVTKIYLWELK